MVETDERCYFSRSSVLSLLVLLPAAEAGVCSAWGCLDNLTLESDADALLSLFHVASVGKICTNEQMNE